MFRFLKFPFFIPVHGICRGISAGIVTIDVKLGQCSDTGSFPDVTTETGRLFAEEIRENSGRVVGEMEMFEYKQLVSLKGLNKWTKLQVLINVKTTLIVNRGNDNTGNKMQL